MIEILTEDMRGRAETNSEITAAPVVLDAVKQAAGGLFPNTGDMPVEWLAGSGCTGRAPGRAGSFGAGEGK